MADDFKNPWGEGSTEYQKWQPGHDASNQYLKWLPQGAAFFDESQEEKEAKWNAVFGDKSTSTEAVEAQDVDSLSQLGPQQGFVEGRQNGNGDDFGDDSEESIFSFVGQNNGDKNTKAKMVFIIIPHRAESKKYAQTYNGKTVASSYYIVANSISSAFIALKIYLKGEKALNVIVDTHGGGSVYPGFMYVNNAAVPKNEANVGITYMNLEELTNPSTDSMKNDVAGLKGIVTLVKNGGNLIFLGCGLAFGTDGKAFTGTISKFNTKINLYASEAYNYGAIAERPNGELALYYHDYYKYCPVIDPKITIVYEGKKFSNVGKKIIKYPMGKANHVKMSNILISGYYGDFKEES